jgi:hypothetical protein
MSETAEPTNISEAQLREEAPQARRLLDTPYFQTITREMQLAAMEQAIVAPTEALRNEARIEALMLRKLIGYLTAIAGSIKDLEVARQGMKANE